MGKKSEKIKEEAAIAAKAAKKEKAAKAPAKKKAATKTTESATKTIAPKTQAKPAFTNDDVALRAYFIAEKRHKAGIPGDAHQDWIEAERQLLAESKKKAPAKAAAPKAVAAKA
jgi:Protein of unknown function (DUF2934)